jgi:basic amino acid/polyamine antiporter, APA family
VRGPLLKTPSRRCAACTAFHRCLVTASPARQLRRSLGIWAITIYAIGDVLGAGIYALVGQVVGLAGSGAWLSFVLSALTALFTGLSYAELSSRFPVAAGAAAYTQRAYGHRLLAFVVGFFVLASGISSAATVSRAFVGYFNPFMALPELPASVAMLALMTTINYAGIRESARVNFVLTMVEMSGLLLIIAVGFWYAGRLPVAEVVGRMTPSLTPGIVSGATLAFFAYIGFEDVANVAEEVRDPSRTIPRAILIAIGVSCVIYVSVVCAVLVTVPREIAANSGKPLLEVLHVAGVHLPPGVFSVVALFAICNTGLLNLIMASRLCYGMACEGLLPSALAQVDVRRGTPWVAVLAAFALAALLTMSGGVRVLAQTTSLLLLIVFAVIHVGLLLIKRRQSEITSREFRTPAWTPVLGAFLCVGLALQYPPDAYARVAVVLALGVALYSTVGRFTAKGTPVSG